MSGLLYGAFPAGGSSLSLLFFLYFVFILLFLIFTAFPGNRILSYFSFSLPPGPRGLNFRKAYIPVRASTLVFI